MKNICPDATMADSLDVGEKLSVFPLTARRRLKNDSMAINKLRSSDAYQESLVKSPLRFALLMSISIFLIEVFIDTVFQRSYKNSILDAILLVFFLSPMLYYFLFLPLYTHIRQRRSAEGALAESDKQLRILCSHLLMAQETERKRISLELHDDLGQALMFLKLRLKFVKDRLADEQTELKEECRESLEYISQVINNVRRLSRDLSPSILEDLGLTAALKGLMEDFDKYSPGVKTSFTMPDNIDCFFSKVDQMLIYRIFQEALTNISKHSQARRLNVSILLDGDDKAALQFKIEDDGGGFEVQKVLDKASGRGFGIATMKQRVRTLGGSFSMDSRPGEGTRLTLNIPMKGENRT